MATEPTDLAASAYEFVNVDSDSQDGRLSESIGSLVVSQPEDVHSLDGSDDRSDAHYNTDSDDDGDSGHSSHASSIRYANQLLDNPSTHPPITQLELDSSPDASSIVARSIEFKEDKDDLVLLEKISVKHVIREFSEEESAALAQRLDLPATPQHLVAAIRQTMSQAYLSTQEPLRIVYIGRSDAQRSIVLKICSAIWASPSPTNGEKNEDYVNRHREGFYNIVPISSFGPAPELDLMEASAYQIKVEHCTSAEETTYDGGTVYSITIEHDKVYRSFLSPAGSIIQPRYSLPHIAVFYCAENDDAEAERTRGATWAFMRRHGVPSVFISEQQDFAKRATGSWDDCIDEHSIHLCLESRDPNRQMPPRRFPIDFASFSDLDARQMNRNLAYLTGLSEPEDSFISVEKPCNEEISEIQLVEFMDSARQTWARFVENGGHWQLLRLLVPVFLAIISPLFIQMYTGTSAPLRPAMSQASIVDDLDTSPICTASPLTTQISSVITSTTTRTVVINRTQTKTISLVSAEPSTSSLASVLSRAGLLVERPSSVPTEPEDKKPINAPKRPVSSPRKCNFSARILGRTRLLVNRAGRNTRLPVDVFIVSVFRGNSPVKIQVSSSDEGIIIDLEPKDAHGALNISVVSNRRPKVNETFEVVFGKNAAARDALDTGLHLLQHVLQKASSKVDEGASRMLKDYSLVNRLVADTVLEAGKFALEAGKDARGRTVETVQRATNSAREHISAQLQVADLVLLEAQIASKLWWLKVQGKMKEHAEYRLRALEYYKMRQNELIKAQASREKGASNKASSNCAEKSSWAPFKKGCVKGGQRGRDSDRDSRWRKIIKG